MDDAKKQLKADIKKLEKEADQRRKDFDKKEAQLKKEALNPSEEQLIGVKAFLEAGKSALDAKFKEFQAAFKKAEDLKTLLNEQRKVSSAAAEAYRKVDDPTLRGKEYDKEKHEKLQDRKLELIDQIDAAKKKLGNWGVELQERRRTRDESESYIKRTKEEISNRATKIEELTKQVNSHKLTINVYKQQQLKSPYHKVAQALAQNQPQMQQAQPQQPQAQQVQPQPKPLGMS